MPINLFGQVGVGYEHITMSVTFGKFNLFRIAIELCPALLTNNVKMIRALDEENDDKSINIEN